MENESTEIINELQFISPFLAEMEKVNVFALPDGYFSDLEQRILTTIFIHQDEKINTQKVPEGYFDSLTDKIFAKLKAEKEENALEEIRSISPALFYLKEEKTFHIPENYFDHLSESIFNKIHPRETNVLSLTSDKKWWKYAAAAVVTGAIVILSLPMFNQNSVLKDTKGVIVTTAKNQSYVQQSAQYKTPEKLNQGIASLSDDEIVNYLEATGNILDEEVIIKNFNEKDLPNADDYLIDENTLNNFLKQSKSESSNKNIQ